MIKRNKRTNLGSLEPSILGRGITESGFLDFSSTDGKNALGIVTEVPIKK